MSTPVNEATTNYALPLPHPGNPGADDCLRLRLAIQGVDAALKSVADSADEKADAADITTALEGVATDLALKADTATVAVSLALKADTADVTAHTADPAAHGLDATMSDLNAALALKADTADVAPVLEGIAEALVTMDASLDLKADAATNTAAHENLATEIEAAKGKATWAGLVGKPSTFPPSAHKHPVGDVTGVLPIANGGTARTDGKAVALATARTISLTGGVTGNVNFDGSGNVSIATTLAGGENKGFFKGMIMPFFGELIGKNPKNPATNAADTAWHVCDGTDGTPDLQDRFVVGAGGSKGNRSTGGAESHTHSVSGGTNTVSVTASGSIQDSTLSVAQLAAHAHKVPLSALYIYGSGAGSGYVATGAGFNANSTGANASHAHGFTGGTSSHGHTVNTTTKSASGVPPYMALYYIMYMG